MKITDIEMSKSIRCDILLGSAQDRAPNGVSGLRLPAALGGFTCSQEVVGKRPTEFSPRPMLGIRKQFICLLFPKETCSLT